MFGILFLNIFGRCLIFGRKSSVDRQWSNFSSLSSTWNKKIFPNITKNQKFSSEIIHLFKIFEQLTDQENNEHEQWAVN